MSDLKQPDSHKVRPIDMKPGMFVIVAEWYPKNEDEAADQPLSVFGLHARARDAKPVGDPLKVLALALPYVTVDVIQHGQRGVLDTRECGFIKVGLDYVRSLVPHYGKRTKPLTDAQRRKAEQVEKKVYFAKSGVWETIVEKKK